MKVGDKVAVDPSEMPHKFREVFVLRPIESAEGMQPKVGRWECFADVKVWYSERKLSFYRVIGRDVRQRSGIEFDTSPLEVQTLNLHVLKKSMNRARRALH